MRNGAPHLPRCRLARRRVRDRRKPDNARRNEADQRATPQDTHEDPPGFEVQIVRRNARSANNAEHPHSHGANASMPAIGDTSHNYAIGIEQDAIDAFVGFVQRATATPRTVDVDRVLIASSEQNAQSELGRRLWMPSAVHRRACASAELDRLHDEPKRLVGSDTRPGRVRAVRLIGRDTQQAESSDSHAGNAVRPSRDHAGEGELQPRFRPRTTNRRSCPCCTPLRCSSR